MGRSVTSCSEVLRGPVPREIHALNRRRVITAGPCACSGRSLWDHNAAPPAATAPARLSNPRRETRRFLGFIRALQVRLKPDTTYSDGPPKGGPYVRSVEAAGALLF